MEAGIARFFFMGEAKLESILKTPEELRLLELCESHLSPLGFRVVDVDCNLTGRSLLRVFVERSGKNGANVDDCALASRTLDPVLDAESWIAGRFDLEVSSPGLERRLRVLEDFEANVGEEVKLKLVEKIKEGAMNVTGKLLAVSPEGIKVAWQGKEVGIPLSQIRRANRVWNYTKD